MNVALFASAFYPNLGGVEELTRQIAHAYRRKGMGVIVLTNRWPRDLPPHELYEEIPLYRLAMRVPETYAKARVSYALTARQVEREMLAILAKHNIDMLHVQCVSANAHWAMKAQKATGLPLVVSAQGELTMDAGALFEKSLWARGMMQDTLRAADVVTACSAQTLAELDAFMETGPDLGGKGRVIYNGIRLAEFDDAGATAPNDKAATRPYVLSIGRHVAQKGFDVLLRAWAQNSKANDTATGLHDIVLAGDGEEHDALKALAVELGVAERVRFVGRVDRREAVRLFKGCALFVLPSRHEPMGIVNLEAMAAGKAIIASRVGGVPELVRDNDNGVLVEGGDASSLAVALKRLLGDPELCARMGKAGRAFVAGFDWDAIAEQYQSAYNDAVIAQRARNSGGAFPVAAATPGAAS